MDIVFKLTDGTEFNIPVGKINSILTSRGSGVCPQFKDSITVKSATISGDLTVGGNTDLSGTIDVNGNNIIVVFFVARCSYDYV